MAEDRPPRSHSKSPSGSLGRQMEQLNLGDSADSPEVAQFRSLPRELQRRMLSEYPRILATAMLQYSGGADCESVLTQLFEGCPEMLRARDTQGDTPVARALLAAQNQRAEKLVELAHMKNPAALDSRSRYGESLLMHTASSSSTASLMKRLLQRDPTQLHRLYDVDGRNFLHHCALEESADALGAALQLTATLIAEDRLNANQVSAAIHMNDRSGDTIMHVMAARNRRDMLSRLLEFGSTVRININVDERQHRDSRQTPLMVAVVAGAVEVAELLVSHGADPSEEDAEGRTALSLAAGNARILRILEGEEAEAVEGAAALANSEGTGVTVGAFGTVDSGMGTFGELPVLSCPADPTPSQPSLSAVEIGRLEAGLRAAGKEAAFLDVFQAGFGPSVELARMTECPAKSLISNLAHEPQCRNLVRNALCKIGEAQLASGI